MDISRKVHPVTQSYRTNIHDCVFCDYLKAWIYLDDTALYKIENYKVKQLLQVSNECVGLYCIDSCIYIIDTDGYTCYNVKTGLCHKVSFDKMVCGFSSKYACLYLKNNSQVQIVKIDTNETWTYDLLSNINYCFAWDLNYNHQKVYIDNNQLVIDYSYYMIPDNVLGEIRWYNFEILNEAFIIIEMCNDFAKNWYILFDMIQRTFTKWYYLKSINHIASLITNQHMIVYDSEILILTSNDLVSLFSNKSLNDLHLRIESGCESMVYHKDKHSPYCLDKHEKYLYYINNNKLMATRTCAPFTMHLLCNLDEIPVLLYAENDQVLIQYENLDIQLVSF